MYHPAQALGALIRATQPLVCAQCWRAFVASAFMQSGHNKWSKIKHDKAVNDAKASVVRTKHLKAIARATKMGGSDPNSNTSLASAIAAAKKSSVPRALIDKAIARGQGKTLSGATLETMTIELMFGPSVALLLEVETANRGRFKHSLNNILRETEEATLGSTKFLFTRTGCLVFQQSEKAGLDDIMEDAINAGAEDLETDKDGNLVVWTQPEQIYQVAGAIGQKFGMKVLESDIKWTPKRDTLVLLDSGQEVQNLLGFLDALEELGEVQAVHANVSKGSISLEEWAPLEQRIGS